MAKSRRVLPSYLRWLPHRFRENQPALAVLVLLILVIIYFAGSMSTGGGAASSALGSSRTSKASGGQNIRPVSSLHYDLTVKAESLVDMMDHASQPQNPGFVFHNKMPKSGSTTVQRLLRTLSNKNHFFYMDMYEHGTNDQDFVVVDAIKENFQMPLLLLKHHFWFNFTLYGLTQPTMVNIVRNPVDWFTSEYYFCRHGWVRRPDYKGPQCQHMSQDQLDMTLDECVAKKHKECVEPSFEYMEWLCGAEELCLTKGSNYQKKMLAVELTKHRVLREYYIVGLLEEFETTLFLFERVLPLYFQGSREVFNSDAIQEVRNTTKTLGKQRLWDSTRRFLEQGPLKYEMDLYNFIKQLFHRKLLAFGINPDDPFGAPVATGEKQVEGMSDFEQAFGAPGGQAAAPNGQPDLAANDPAQAAVGIPQIQSQMPGMIPVGGAMQMPAMPGQMPMGQMQMPGQMPMGQMQMQMPGQMPGQMPMGQMPMQMPMGAIPGAVPGQQMGVMPQMGMMPQAGMPMPGAPQ